MPITGPVVSRSAISLGTVLLLLAVIDFILLSFGVTLGDKYGLLGPGLALFAGGVLTSGVVL